MKKLKCLLGLHDGVEVFDVFYTDPRTGLELGVYNKYCAYCGKLH